MTNPTNSVHGPTMSQIDVREMRIQAIIASLQQEHGPFRIMRYDTSDSLSNKALTFQEVWEATNDSTLLALFINNSDADDCYTLCVGSDMVMNEL